MEDPTEPSGLHQLVGVGDRRNPSVVEPDEALHALPSGLLRRVPHQSGIFERAGHRLFAGDVRAGFERCDGHLGVKMIGRADVDEIDLGITDQGLPVVGAGGPSPLPGEFFGFCEVASTGRMHHQRPRQIEESSRGSPGIRVRATHESRSEHRNPEFGGLLRAPSGRRGGTSSRLLLLGHLCDSPGRQVEFLAKVILLADAVSLRASPKQGLQTCPSIRLRPPPPTLVPDSTN